MEALVPQTTFEVSQILQAIVLYSTPEAVKGHLSPPHLDEHGIVFDLSLTVNIFAVSDFYIPVLRGKRTVAEQLCEDLWLLFTQKASLTSQLVERLDGCIDKGQPTSSELIQQLTTVVQRLQA